jgi:kynureninase
MTVSKIRSFRVDGVNKFATAKEQLQEYLISVEGYFKLKTLEEMQAGRDDSALLLTELLIQFVAARKATLRCQLRDAQSPQAGARRSGAAPHVCDHLYRSPADFGDVVFALAKVPLTHASFSSCCLQPHRE